MLDLVVGLLMSVVAFVSFQIADDFRLEAINGGDTEIKVLLCFLLGCACVGVSGYILISHLGVL